MNENKMIIKEQKGNEWNEIYSSKGNEWKRKESNGIEITNLVWMF